MGLDIYAGTLTRYYSHNWKTVVQQWAEENGYAFNRITPDGETADNEEEMSPAEIQAAVENWRDQILSAISQPGQPPYAPWLENNEKRQTGQWTQEDEAGYQLYRQETDPEKRTFRVWYLIANPRGLPKEFVQKELEFRWKLFPEKKEEPK